MTLCIRQEYVSSVGWLVGV